MWDCRAGARAESWWMSDGGFLRFSVFNNFLYLKKFLFKFSVRNVHVLFGEVSLTRQLDCETCTVVCFFLTLL